MSGLERSKNSAFDASKTLREELVYLALPDQFGLVYAWGGQSLVCTIIKNGIQKQSSQFYSVL